MRKDRLAEQHRQFSLTEAQGYQQQTVQTPLVEREQSALRLESSRHPLYPTAHPTTEGVRLWYLLTVCSSSPRFSFLSR